MTNIEIKELRKLLNLTQGEFAQLLGVGGSTIKDWEQRISKPNEENLKKLIKLKEETRCQKDIIG